ncbi:MAG: S9 family peptidase [Deltaproteobacteria bacterium]|nr:S9 family peptidase [Deltaproteobacteria bacterium]
MFRPLDPPRRFAHHRHSPEVTVRYAAIGFALMGSALLWGCQVAPRTDILSAEDVIRIRQVVEARISPDGRQVAYLLNVLRPLNAKKDGDGWRELHVVDAAGRNRPYVSGQVQIKQPRWHGRYIYYLARRFADETVSLYRIAVDGGESQVVLQHKTSISNYALSDDGKRVAIVAAHGLPAARERLAKKDVKITVYEEDGLNHELFFADLQADGRAADLVPVKLDGSPSTIAFAPSGEQLAVAVAPSARIDDYYVNRKIQLIALPAGRVLRRYDNPGKLGPLRFSPDGANLALISAADRNDPLAGRLLIAPISGGPLHDLLPDFKGHVVDALWRDAQTLIYLADVKTTTLVGEVTLDGKRSELLFREQQPILRTISQAQDGTLAMVADARLHPGEVYRLPRGGKLQRLTDSNRWLADRRLAAQRTVELKARDGLNLQGILIAPLSGQGPAPLIMVVHGGPESHVRDGWLTSYLNPGQVAAAEGFAVFYPNYRGSTGRGVAFSKLSQGDPAGREFDDLVDAKNYLVKIGVADQKRVGITGGSYGGFAAAWAATKLTKEFAAAVMYAGVSDHISKLGTTDIPYEMYRVHSRGWPWNDEAFFRKRSPLSYVNQARTPLLICSGDADTRVDPSQSKMLYRYLKTIGRTPVRLVLYGKEPHGNTRTMTRYDFELRWLRWFRHFLVKQRSDLPAHRLAYRLDEKELKKP